MQKQITPQQARETVEGCHSAGLQVGAFFIIYYPGETDETVLNTLRFATSLPLDYLGLTMPYILPGTALYDRLKDSLQHDQGPDLFSLVNRAPVYDVEFSKTKMQFAVYKGLAQFKIRKNLGRLAPMFLKLFDKPSDHLIKWLR